jgi:hypothetical protein
MNHLLRASYLGYRETALIPAFSPWRRRIVASWLEIANDHSGSGVQCARFFGEISPLPSPQGASLRSEASSYAKATADGTAAMEGELSPDGSRRRETISVPSPNACGNRKGPSMNRPNRRQVLECDSQSLGPNAHPTLAGALQYN